MASTMKSRAFSIAVTLLLVGAAALSLTAALRRSATGDEFGTIWLASQPGPAFIVAKVMSSDVHPPTPYLLLHAWGRAFGYRDIAMRLPSLVFVLLSLGVVWRLIPRLVPSLADDQRRLVFLLCCVSPVLWVQSATARYHALSTFAGLLAISCYLDWRARPARGRRVGYVVATAATFYVHYLLAALVLAGQWLHSAAVRPRPARRSWFSAQLAILALALPIVVASTIPLLTGESPMLANRAAEGVTGLKAIPLVLAGHLFTALTGGVPFPWDFWVTVPLALVVLGVATADLRGSKLLLDRTELSLVIVPFFLLVLAIALILPVAGYFQGILRVGHIAMLAWITLGILVARLSRPVARWVAAGVVIACSAYSLVVHGLDLFSMIQCAPLKAVSQRLAAEPGTVVFHPFVHGWGDPLQRYAGRIPTYSILDAIADPPVTEYEREIAGRRDPVVWVVKRNRFSVRADELAGWLVTNGYARAESIPIQPQRPYDIRFKEWLKSIPALGFKPSPSHASYWTMTRYERLAP